MPDLEGEFILNSAADTNTPQKSSVKTENLSGHTTNKSSFFSSFCEYPEGFRYADQEEGEEIALLLRRHFVVNIPWIIGAILLAILPTFFPFIIAGFPIPLPGGQTLFYFTLFYYIILLGFIIINFSLWYFNAGIVTNKRVIDIDLAGILFRQISEAKIKNIEEVTYKQVGFVSSLFNYGDVYVQTAGEEVNIEFDRIPRPSKVADIINDLAVK